MSHFKATLLALMPAFTAGSLMLGCGDGAGGDGGRGADAAVGPIDAAATIADASDPSGDLDPPASGFQIRSPDVTLQPGDEKTFCYYTTIPAAQAQGVKRWVSRMTPGSHHLILYFTSGAQQPDGTLSENCGGGAGVDAPVWTYAAQNVEAELAMPDGVGMSVAAGQHAFVQMHYVNAGESVIHAHVTVNGETFAPGTSYVQASAFITYNTEINVPPGHAGSVEGDCAVPAGAKFFLMSTHAHHWSTHTEVKDGDTMIFESDNWEEPGAKTWTAPSYFQFAGKLHYRCDNFNDGTTTLHSGSSAKTDDMCMATGYFFPSTGPEFCLNSMTVQ